MENKWKIWLIQDVMGDGYEAIALVTVALAAGELNLKIEDLLVMVVVVVEEEKPILFYPSFSFCFY